MTKAELEKRLAEQATQIADLEKKVDELEDEASGRNWEQDALEVELRARFEVLCRELDARSPIRILPISLQLEFESLAEQLGVPRPWGISYG